MRHGFANGLRGLSDVEADGIRELEPHGTGIRGLHVPETGIVDFRRVALADADEVQARGGDILLGSRVVGLDRRDGGRRLDLERGEPAHAEHVVACAGLHSDRVAAITGSAPPAYRIVPFRGDYYTLAPEARSLVAGLIYPVPNPSFPFLGVHFTRRIDGAVWAGPNAVPAFAREGYSRWSLSMRDLGATIGFPGFRRRARVRSHGHGGQRRHPLPSGCEAQGLTRAVAVLFAVFGSGVELETWAVFVIQPLPLALIEVVSVNDAAPPCASEARSQRTVRVEPVYVQPGAETKDKRDGSTSVTTTV
jgi:glycine/D-amino acid oxidase-like deaminating enzyme